MEAAFVEIGLEKNGFLYVDEIVGPELEKGHGRKIQDLIKRGETILVQAVKDPMKTKGARLTTQISLPGRFVVLVPQGEGLGVSRRLDDDERNRLKDILKRLDVKEGGVIVRTAAEGASEEDIERDLVFLQRLWKSIQAKAKDAKAPELVYQEAELPLRVVRDLFTGDFEKAYVDDERTHKRIVGYLKKTSPHMVERVVRYREKTPLMESFGVEQEIRSTIGRRVDLPSGGYLIFDYAEAFTVIDVNTGRFVGGRGKNSGGRLEDTITKNNLEAVKEVVRQLRLRDIGGIIVIDFIDMANPKNRATVEEALRTELERDRTKTYVVEISPLGLVEMTRQNVTDGPREVMTRKCPTCGGDGIVYSEASAAIDVERRLRALAAGSRSQAFRVELADPIASALVGPGARRLIELEALTKKRFFLEGKPADAPRPLRRPLRGQARRPRAGGARRGGRGAHARARRGRPLRRRGRRRQARRARRRRRRARPRRSGSASRCASSASSTAARTPCVREDEGGGRAADRRGRGREADPQAAGAQGRGRDDGRRGAAEEPRSRTSPRSTSEPEVAEEPEAERPSRGRSEERRRRRGSAPKKKTRRGSRGGRNRKKPAALRARRRSEAPATRRSLRSLARRHDPRPRRRSRPRGRSGAGGGSAGGARARGDGSADEPPRRREAADGDAASAPRRRRAVARAAAATARRSLRPTSAERRRGGRRRRAGSGGRSLPRKTAIATTSRCPSGSTSSSPRLATLPDSRAPSPRFHAMSGYAIISLGGKQYRVHEGERLLVDRLRVDEGKTLEPRVLLVGGNGAPDLSPSTTVTARVVGHELGEKIRIGKYSRRTGYKKHNGHRSRLTRIEIESIGAAKRATKSAEKPKTEGGGEACAEADGGAAGGRPAGGLRVDDDRGAHGGGGRLEPRTGRGGARARALRQGAEGRARGARSSTGGEELMAHKKGLGSSRNGRDSNPKMLGVKIFDGQDVTSGMILVRQRGTRFRPGPGTGIGKDDTIFAMRDGKVAFRTSGERRFISVVAAD